MRRDEVDAARLHARPQRARVVAAIRDDARGLHRRATPPGTGDGDRRKRGLGEPGLGVIGSQKVHTERKTLAVDQYHELCPLTRAGLADARPPFVAGMKVPSRNASLQSSCRRSSNSARKARQIVSHTSARSHALNRRQHVAGLGYSRGRSRHRAPVRRIQRIPSKHARSGTRGRPPLGFARCMGSNGAIRAHCSSVNNCARARCVRSIATVLPQTAADDRKLLARL